MNIYQQIESNKRRTFLLMLVAFLFVFVVAFSIQETYGYGWELTLVAMAFALGSNALAYFKGDAMALALNGAREIQKQDNPYLWNMVENLCISQGLPMPRVYIIPDQAMNAFATGRDPQHASVAFTQGIIDALENEELEGVVAHELSHIQNYDIRTMTIVAAVIGVIMVLVDMAWRISFFGGSRDDNGKAGGVLAIVGLILIILSPIVAQLIQFAISRKREFLADASGALMTRYPEGLARALQKISHQGRPLKKVNHGTAHLFIANPFGAQARKNINKFFSTHPPVEERMSRLHEMGNIK
jgi:heat shock protein HtpX